MNNSFYVKIMSHIDSLKDFQIFVALTIEFVKDNNLLPQLDEYLKSNWPKEEE